MLHLLYFNKRRLYTFQSPLNGKGLKKGLVFKVIRISMTSISKQLNKEQHKLSEVNKQGVVNLQLYSLTMRILGRSTTSLINEFKYKRVFSN